MTLNQRVRGVLLVGRLELNAEMIIKKWNEIWEILIIWSINTASRTGVRARVGRDENRARQLWFVVALN